MPRKADAELLKMMEHLEASKGGRGRRSPLFHWLLQRAPDFEQMIRGRCPSWQSVAAAAAELGLTDGSGKLPTGERARKTWFEVRRAKGWVTPKPTVAVAPPALLQPKPAVVPSRAPMRASDPLPPSAAKEDARAKFLARFKPVTLPSKN